MDGNDGLFGWVPDMDHDGDHDLMDFMHYDDLVLSDDESDTHTYFDDSSDDNFEDDLDEDSDDIFEDDVNEDIPQKTDSFINGIKFRIKFEENSDAPDPYISLEEEPGGDKIEDQKYQRELSKRYIAQRQNKAANIVKAAKLGRYEPYDPKMLPIARLIAENKCEASKYLSFDGWYLFSTAISDHFNLPFVVPAELDRRKYSFSTLFEELAENNLDQVMEIWNWCLDTFQPYLDYSKEESELTSSILYCLNNALADEFLKTVIKYMKDHAGFVEKVVLNGINLDSPIDLLIVVALGQEKIALAKEIFESILHNKNTDIHNKIKIISGLANGSCYYQNVTPLKLFREHLFPMVRELTDPRIRNKIRIWEKEMEERIRMEEEDEEILEELEEEEKTENKYQWRQHCMRQYGLDPENYETIEEYETAVCHAREEKNKYIWRQHCVRRYDLDPENYETRDEYEAAVSLARLQERYEKEKVLYQSPDSTKLCQFCIVSIDFPRKPYYYYFPGNETVAVGDKVLVPFGANNEEKIGVVVSVGECYAASLPCPIDKMKTVIRKLKE